MTIKEMNEIKEKRGYSYKKLSEYSGIPAVTIQKILSGKTKNPRQATLNALERVLNGAEEIFAGKALSYEMSGFSAGDVNFSGVVKEEMQAYRVKKDGEYTVDDYNALPEDCLTELIDGVFFENEAPVFVHQEIISLVSNSFYNYIKENNGKCRVIASPSNVRLDCDDKTMVQPDLYVICDREKIKRYGIYGAPDFILEVLSPSTRKKDLDLKMHKYWNAGVKEYWIIDPVKKVLITYDFTDNDVIPVIYPFKGKAPVAIYDGKLLIDLDEIGEAVEEYPE